MSGSLQLRGWQRDAFALYLDVIRKNGKTLLWEATPGAGKTAVALEVVKHQLMSRIARRTIVVVPTSHLRAQWARAAARTGVQLDSAFTNSRGVVTKDFHGAVLTYQQVGMQPKLLQSVASGAVVVLDEIHHAGDGLTWGNSLRVALTEAKFVLALSGTAFRSDNNAIPFVRYDETGQSVPDYTYSYARAIEEGVCRPTAFFTYGGSVSWAEGDRQKSADFGDMLDSAGAARRLRVALDPDSNWSEPMLRDADRMLDTVRREHPVAGGLVVCADQDHARRTAKLLATVANEKPTVVLSDDSTASRKIKTFTDSRDRWLVACNMVSEGVDIPRLRVGVYATTVRTKMYFRQFLGRIVRRQGHIPGLQVAYLYLPADPHLHRLAEEIEHEIRHSLVKLEQSLFDEPRENNREDYEKKPPEWTVLQGVNSGVDSVIVHGNQLSLFGGGLHPDEVRDVVNREIEIRLEEGQTRSEVKGELATEIKRLVGMLHRKWNKPHSAIHTTLNRRQSVRSQTHCTEEQLHERISLLKAMISGRALESTPQARPSSLSAADRKS